MRRAKGCRVRAVSLLTPPLAKAEASHTVAAWPFRLRGHPGRLSLVVSVAVSLLERVLGGIHGEVPAAVLLGGMKGRERYGHILFTESEKAADRNNQGFDLTVLPY
jgi:hypothetical protein